MSEYDDWKQENDRWEAYLYPNGVLRNKLGITKAAKWHKMEREFVAARNAALRPNTGLTTGNVGEELFAGTTSACAENTDPVAISLLTWGNYLRVRGEYTGETYTDVGLSELPPRARRIHHFRMCHGLTGGTTSACAENTLHSSTPANHKRNYLRVRGEYLPSESNACTPMELPPRARRIRFGCGYHPAPLGTTSACAENTVLCPLRGCPGWNYLRVRGEYIRAGSRGRPRWELPPRARRIRTRPCAFDNANGTTSACAENTPHYLVYLGRSRNYLRVRGEYLRTRVR